MSNKPAAETLETRGHFGGAFGAGAVLVVLPSIGLFFGVKYLGATPMVGLPVLAIFGIMILFGALALTSTLFARLGLDNPDEALALPAGSVRAAIALALIVLFAILSIMLFQSMSKPYEINGLSATEKNALVQSLANRVIAVIPKCPGDAACSEAERQYSVHVLQPPGQESADLAKQLLVLIGTLMTSVTSFYFAARATEPKRTDPNQRNGEPESITAALANENAIDGCDIPTQAVTADEDLPPARGGVVS